MKILIYEHASGGGLAEGTISSSILCEGFGMLRTLVADFKAAGHQVTVLLNDRLSKLNPPLNADCIIPISTFQEARVVLQRVSESVNAAYIIAPETGQTLQSLVETVEQTGVSSLNCKSNSIRTVADKASLFETLRMRGLPTPKTATVNVHEKLATIKDTIKNQFTYPVVFKPSDGVGCGGLSLVKNEFQVDGAIAKIKADTSNEHFIVQEYISGEAASVCLLAAGTETLPISLNNQDISIGAPNEASSYNGGTVPFEHPLRHEAFKVAEEVVAGFGGLRGYVGVDLVLSETGPVVVDVNPRLTTSYVGLSKVASFNVAQAILDAVLKDKLPTNHEFRGVACFSKVQTTKPTTYILQKTYGLAEVISPPFPVQESSSPYALVSGVGETLENANRQLEEAKKRILDIVSMRC